MAQSGTGEGAESQATVGEPPSPSDTAVIVCEPSPPSDINARVRDAHERAGHPGKRRTLYFARSDVTRPVLW